jgi:hypothetical protein
MHVNLSRLKVKERWTSSLFVFVRGVDTLKANQAVCLNYWHTAQTALYTAEDMPSEVSSLSPSPEQTMGGAQYYIEP